MRVRLFCLLLPLVASCAVGPDYVPPYVIAPQEFKEAAADAPMKESDWQPANPGSVDTLPWWKSFDDMTLNGLMSQLDAANQNIRVALANLRQARAAVREARSAFFPGVDASGSARRGKTTRGQSVGETYTAQLQASWELDLWGGTRRTVESEEAEAAASAADFAGVLLSMRAELAQNYFQLRAYDEQRALYARTVEAFARSLSITRNQHAAGVITRMDVAQAEAQLKAAEAQAIDLDLQRRRTEHAIAVLLGQPPAFFSMATGSLPDTIPQIGATLPASLLERRPDIAGAERRVAAANARIGVAISAYSPTLDLAASIGYISDAANAWFLVPNQVWSFGPSLALNLFDGGARRARTEQAEAAWEAAVANYRQAVLSAFQEVEGQLAATELLRDEESKQLEALSAAREAERLALSQYTAGTVTYLSVVSAQTTALSNARSAAILRGQRFMTAVALIRALGGGWQQENTAGNAADPQPQ